MPIRPPSIGSPMTQPLAFRRFAQVAQKWRNLVELRCAQFIELHKSGGWKYHYTEAQFLELMREAIDLAETWSRLAPRPGDRDEALGKADSVPNPRRRTAA
jgi:hypothetical protein